MRFAFKRDAWTTIRVLFRLARGAHLTGQRPDTRGEEALLLGVGHIFTASGRVKKEQSAHNPMQSNG